MAEMDFEFEWRTDPKGHRLVKTKLGDHIVRNGGKLKPYRPLDRFGNLLCREFARVDSGPALVDFVDRFGPLTKKGFEEGGEPVDILLKSAEEMRVLEAIVTGGGYSQLARAFGPGTILATPGRIETALIVDPLTRRPRLQLKIPNLINAVWLQMGQMLASDATLRSCLHCGAPFEVGLGTGRRSDAKFCSDKHRSAYNNDNRRKEA